MKIIQCFSVIAIAGMIGLSAMAWNGNYERGSAIDVVKTQAQRGIK